MSLGQRRYGFKRVCQDWSCALDVESCGLLLITQFQHTFYSLWQLQVIQAPRF